MKNITSLFIITSALLLSNIKVYCQDKSNIDLPMAEIIKIDSLFKCYGVIFDSSYKTPIEIHNIKERFTPVKADILTAEKVFKEQYNATNQTIESRKGAKTLDDVKRYFENFNRQYFGYIDNDGNRNLIVHLFDFSKKRIVRKYVGDSWKNNFLILLSDKVPFEIVTYRINLTQQKLYGTF